MGFKSFWSQLTSSRVKEISPESQPQPPYFNRQRSATLTSVQNARQYNAQTSVVAEAVLSQPSLPLDQKAKRRSRGFSLSRNKSENDLGLKKRRSWFGGKPSDQEDVPAVPALPAFSHERGRHLRRAEKDPARPGTALTTDAPVTWSRSQSPASDRERADQPILMSPASDRNRTIPAKSRSAPKKRQSTFAEKMSQQDLPPVPASPATLPVPSRLVDPQSGIAPPDEKAKSKRKSLVKRLSLHSLNRSKSAGDLGAAKQWSWTQDEQNQTPQIPPVPSLVYDGSITPESSVPNTSSPDNSEQTRDPAYMRRLNHKSYYDNPVHTVTRGGSIKQPRPLSLPARRMSYVPKNAASGFLRSVSGASLTANTHARKTMLDDPNESTGGVGQEQQLEWDKLKRLLEEMEKEQNNGVMGMLRELDDEEADDERQVYANAQALAALEFGVDAR